VSYWISKLSENHTRSIPAKLAWHYHLKTVDWSYNNFTLHLIDDVLLSLWTRNIQLCNIHTLNYTLNSEDRLRDDFNFPFVNFPFICCNISAPCEYGVCYSRLLVPIRISVIDDCCWKKYWTKRSWWLDLNNHFKSFMVVISTYEWPWICSVCLLLHRKLKTGDHHLEPGMNRKRTSSCSNSVTLAINLILSQEWGNKRQTEHIHGHS
jgi:hypothetical protein